MSYGTVLDFINQFGAQYSTELFDRSIDNDLSAECLLATAKSADLSSYKQQDKTATDIAITLINQHLNDAEKEINGYLNARYQLPVFGDIDGTPLKRVTCDIARYLVANTADMASEIIDDRYKESIKWLKDVSTGKVVLALNGVSKQQTTAGVGFTTGKKTKIDGY